MALVKKVEGVKSVNDKLHVKDSEKQSVSGYAGDAATTSEIKAKLLADDIVPSRKIKVETTNGVVQLSGAVENQAQSERAESIAKAIEGVKSVKMTCRSKIMLFRRGPDRPCRRYPVKKNIHGATPEFAE